MRMETIIALKTERFACFDNSLLMTTEYCETRITAIALPIRISSFLSCLLLFVPQDLVYFHMFQ